MTPRYLDGRDPPRSAFRVSERGAPCACRTCAGSNEQVRSSASAQGCEWSSTSCGQQPALLDTSRPALVRLLRWHFKRGEIQPLTKSIHTGGHNTHTPPVSCASQELLTLTPLEGQQMRKAPGGLAGNDRDAVANDVTGMGQAGRRWLQPTIVLSLMFPLQVTGVSPRDAFTRVSPKDAFTQEVDRCAHIPRVLGPASKRSNAAFCQMLLTAHKNGLSNASLVVDVGTERGDEVRIARAYGHPIVTFECRGDLAVSLSNDRSPAAVLSPNVRLVHSCVSDYSGLARLHRAVDSSSLISKSLDHVPAFKRDKEAARPTESVAVLPLDRLAAPWARRPMDLAPLARLQSHAPIHSAGPAIGPTAAAHLPLTAVYVPPRLRGQGGRRQLSGSSRVGCELAHRLDQGRCARGGSGCAARRTAHASKATAFPLLRAVPTSAGGTGGQACLVCGRPGSV